MSVVERAIKKIRGAKPGAKPGAKAVENEVPIARSVVNKVLHTQAEVRASDSNSFRGDSECSIDFDFAALSAAGLLAQGNDRLADEYRAIKQPILRKARNKTVGEGFADRLIMITSALPGEGKTFTSVNLSLSLAQERDWSVLLIDTDCRNPSLSRLLGVDEQPGLLDFLRSPEDGLESYVLPTNIDRLFILPLGQSGIEAAELLASDRMRAVCASISAGDFGNVIAVFDSSPVLLTPEPIIISAHIGQIAFVVRANSTPRNAVFDAVGKLDPEKAIGMVLNRASADDRLSSYAYGYSYADYRRYSADTEASSSC